MAGPTVLSVGGVEISATGGHTGDVLASIAALFASTVTGVAPETETPASGATTLPTPPNDGLVHALVIPAGYQGDMSIPAGYTYVVYGGTGTLTGGDANSVVVGDQLDYIGAAGTVVGSGTGGSVTDNTNHAMLSFFSGNYSVTSSGDGVKVFIDAAADGNVKLTGFNSSETFGTAPGQGGQAGSNAVSTIAGAANTAVLSGQNDVANVWAGDNTITAVGKNNHIDVQGGSNNLIFVTGTTVVNQSVGNTTVVTGQGGTVTLNATGGNELVFDSAGGNMVHGGTNTEFVGAVTGSASSFISSLGGSDTIFASAINYDGHLAANSLMLGGAGTATVLAATNETLFGGTGGGTYAEGTGSFFFFGGGGSDTITGIAGSAQATVWGNSHEDVVVSNPGASQGNVFISFGNNDTINAQNAAGGNNFQIVNQTIPAGAGGTFTGTTTLVGATAGHDSFTIYTDNSNPAAHTITIQNWQASDSMFVENLSNPGVGLSGADSAAIANFLGGASGNNFVLADGTKVEFTNTNVTTGFNIGHV